MKNLKILAFALVAVLTAVGFASCGDDDDETAAGSNALVGTWQITHATGYEKVDGEIENEYDMDVTASTLSDDVTYCRVRFTSDGKINVYTWSGSSWVAAEGESTYKVSGSTLIVHGSEDVLSGTYSVSGSTLTLVSDEISTYDGSEYEEYEKLTFKKVE